MMAVSVSAEGRPLSNPGYRLQKERSDCSNRHPGIEPTPQLVAAGDPITANVLAPP